jgi:hypothetical protein
MELWIEIQMQLPNIILFFLFHLYRTELIFFISYNELKSEFIRKEKNGIY